MKEIMEKQTVFIKRYPSKGELPKESGFYLTNSVSSHYIGNEISGWFDCEPQWWLEEVELPIGEDLSYDMETPLRKGSSLWWHTQGFRAGANYILNKLKGGNK